MSESWSQDWSHCGDSHLSATSVEEVTFKNQFIPLLLPQGQEIHTSSLLGEVSFPACPPGRPCLHPPPLQHLPSSVPSCQDQHTNRITLSPAREHQRFLVQLESKRSLEEDPCAPTDGSSWCIKRKPRFNTTLCGICSLLRA